MTLCELSIRRHVLAVMISVLIVLFGAIAYQEVGNDRMPNIDFPMISVSVSLPGADPELVDSAVTEEVERAVNTVPGIDTITSDSLPGRSIVTIQFKLDVDIDVAFNEVNAKISQLVQDLPSDAEAPVVDKVELNAQPVMWLSLVGDRTTQDLDRYARNEIRPQLEGITGVGEVRVGGGRERTLRIELDPERMAAHHIDAQQIMRVLEVEHAQVPGGFLVAGETEELLKLDAEFHTAAGLAEMVVGGSGDELIRLKEVADVTDGLSDMRRLARSNGEPTIGLGIVKIPGANTVEIIEEVKARLEDQIRPQLPPGLELNISTDESAFILEQIDALYLTIALGVFFAALVMWLFLRNLRSTTIIALSIPISLMAVVAVIYFFGYTLNAITMLAMLLLIGIVVDDAIVVLENIYRHRQQYGKAPIAAAISGSNEVFFAVIATTLTLVSIFGSVLFMEAIIGRFFESFAVVVTFGVLASSLVALTLIPMLASRFLHIPEKHGKAYYLLERSFERVETFYRNSLRLVLRFRWTTLALSLLFAIVVAVLVAPRVGGEFTPDEDTGEFMVTFQTPLGSGIAYTDARMREIEAILSAQPEIDRYFAAIGLGGRSQVNRGMAFVRLHGRDQREATQQEIIARITPELAAVPGVRAFASDVSFVPGQRGEPLQFVLTGPNIERLGEYAHTVQQRLEETAGMGSIDLDLDLELPRLEIEIDRERAHTLGLNTRDIAQAVNVLAGGFDVARFDDGPQGSDGRRYDIRIKAREGAITDADSLNRIQLRSQSGEMVPLEAVTSVRESVGPATVTRHNLSYSATFYVDPELPLAEAVEELRTVSSEVLPLGYQVELTGQAEEMERAITEVLFVLLLAAALVYIVLASQFNSFVQPVIIMAAQPLALVGGVLGLYLGGYTLNIFSMIGMVLLMGLVTKNGILLVDLTNQYREKRGLAIDEALAEACPVRLRPVLMTSLTLILALIPAAAGFGAGSESNAPMAAAIIGGMITSMLLTLAVIPAAYSLVEGFLSRRWGDRTRLISEESLQ